MTVSFSASIKTIKLYVQHILDDGRYLAKAHCTQVLRILIVVILFKIHLTIHLIKNYLFYY
jgi:hypothetical protein